MLRAEEYVMRQEKLAIDSVRVDGGTQIRVHIDEDAVADYATAKELPPVIVFFDGTDYWLADGFHRWHAQRRAKHKKIMAEIREGTQRDAVLYAVGANTEHGLRRTNEDKRKAVQTLLNDAEWSKWSDREIARKCCVSHTLADKVRQEIASASGNRCQMDDDNGESETLSNPDSDPSEPTTSPPETAPPAPRTVERNGTTYTMDTAGIGGKKPAAKRKSKEEESDDDGEPAPELPEEPNTQPEPAHHILLDSLDRPVPDNLLPAFQALDLYDELEKHLRKVAEIVNQIAWGPGGHDLRRRCQLQERNGKQSFRLDRIRDATFDIKQARPYAGMCPYCVTDNDGIPDKQCKACFGEGWVGKGTWDGIPADRKAEAQARMKEAQSCD